MVYLPTFTPYPNVGIIELIEHTLSVWDTGKYPAVLFFVAQLDLVVLVSFRCFRRFLESAPISVKEDSFLAAVFLWTSMCFMAFHGGICFSWKLIRPFGFNPILKWKLSLRWQRLFPLLKGKRCFVKKWGANGTMYGIFTNIYHAFIRGAFGAKHWTLFKLLLGDDLFRSDFRQFWRVADVSYKIF